MSNAAWGFFGLAATCALTVLGLGPTYEWVRPWLLGGAVTFIVASAICFIAPLFHVRARRKVLAALNDVFRNTRELTNMEPRTSEEYELWKTKVNQHEAWIRQRLRRRLSVAEIDVIIAGPQGPQLNLGGRFGSEHAHLLNYLHYLEHRVSRSIEGLR